MLRRVWVGGKLDPAGVAASLIASWWAGVSAGVLPQQEVQEALVLESLGMGILKPLLEWQPPIIRMAVPAIGLIAPSAEGADPLVLGMVCVVVSRLG